MIKNLIVFLKSPRLGKVKTRLAKDLGSEKALHIYRWLVDFTLTQSKMVDAKLHLYLNEIPENDQSFLHRTIEIQKGTDLGEKMMNALKDFQQEGPVVLIGSDCPEISSTIIEKAFEALSDHDVVLGPALDGGFYLIAVNQFPDSVFNDVEWGNSDVLKRIMHNLKSKTVYQLPVLSDLDDLNDFMNFEVAYKEYLISNAIVETKN